MHVICFSDTVPCVCHLSHYIYVLPALGAVVCILDMLQDSRMLHSITYVLQQALCIAEMLSAKTHFNVFEVQCTTSPQRRPSRETFF